MKTSGARLLAVACITTIVVSAALVVVKPTVAALGNSGVPVECHVGGYLTISPDSTAFLGCVAADGTAFDSGTRVPSGRYLLVTDVVVTYSGGAESWDSYAILTIYDAYGESDRGASLWLRNPVKGTLSEHFATPYLVLPASHRLEVVNPSSSFHVVYVAVSGLLVTNLTYLPLVNR